MTSAAPGGGRVSNPAGVPLRHRAKVLMQKSKQLPGAANKLLNAPALNSLRESFSFFSNNSPTASGPSQPPTGPAGPRWSKCARAGSAQSQRAATSLSPVSLCLSPTTAVQRSAFALGRRRDASAPGPRASEPRIWRVGGAGWVLDPEVGESV